MRTIRSYVLRQGRISPAQARARRELLAKHGVSYRQATLDLDQLFARRAPKIVEIGFGMGEALAEHAREHPECNFLGIEVYSPGVGSLLNVIERERLANLKIVQHDAVEVLRDMITPRSLCGLHILFPDPWPKTRHHKRRLINRDFVVLCRDRVAAGGYIQMATDWEPYAREMYSLFSEAFAPGAARRRPRTKFESKGEQAGREVYDMVFTRLHE